jgi:hypothetical protein
MSAAGSGGAATSSTSYLDYLVSVASLLASYMRLPVLASSVSSCFPVADHPR